jgi:Domain of unknown function (DUF2382)
MLDREGNRIGSIDVIYLDDQTGQPEWALVNTGLFGTKATTDANIGAAISGPEISEEEHEVVLREEEPVVEKRGCARERVRLGKEAVTGEERVAEQVRQEQIEVRTRTERAGGTSVAGVARRSVPMVQARSRRCQEALL